MEAVAVWLGHWTDNSVLLFLAIFVMSVFHIFFPPLPVESSLMVLIGYLAGIGHSGLFLIWLALTAGASFGSLTVYLVTLHQGEILLRWKLIRKQLSRNYMRKAEIWFKKYGILAILGGKCVPGMSLVVLFCCGLFKLPQRRGIPAILFSNTVYYIGMVLLGRYLGIRWTALAGQLGRLLPWISLVVVIALAILVIHLLRKKRAG